MLIDWFTVVAQALNFLILVWLLKRFLFGPISNAISERQASISATLVEAAATKLQAETEKEQYQTQKAELEQRRDTVLKEAVAAAEAEKKRLLEEAQRVADALRQSRLESLQSQEHKLEQALRLRAQEHALSLARDILGRLSATELDRAMVATFLERLAQLEPASLETLVGALEPTGGQVQVRAAGELSGSLRAELEAGVEKVLLQKLQWSYRLDPTLVSGFELMAEGHKLSWSSAELLEKVQTGARRAQPS